MSFVPNPDPEQLRRVGLCVTCRHSRVIRSSKGSEFWLCERAQSDATYKKYPPLPVVRCRGHEKA